MPSTRNMDLPLVIAVVIFALTLDEAFSYHCDFESGMCGWKNDPSNPDGCGWTLRKGLGVTPYSGPFADHTYGNPNGTYLYLQSSYCVDNEDILGPGISRPIEGFTQKSICVKLWYLMYGNGNNYQFSLRKADSDDPPVLFRLANYGRSWKFAQVSMEQPASRYKLTFAAGANDLYTDVALDDIEIVDGQCEPAAGLCDFERGDLCGFNVTSGTGGFKWNHDTALNVSQDFFDSSPADHTLSSPVGRLAYAYASGTGQGTTSMVSPWQESPETEQCLTFYYFILYHEPDGEESKVDLSVYILTSRQQSTTLTWRAVGGNNNFWEYATVPISLKERYQYLFAASKDNLTTEIIFLLDDISVQIWPCPEKLTCSFTNGSLCGWSNPHQDGIAGPQLTWLVEEPYPDIWSGADNTGQNGSYLFVDSSYGDPGAVSQVAICSQRLPWKTNGSWCFAFSYRFLLAGNTVATLGVDQSLLSGFITNNLFSTSDPTDGKWVNVQLDVTMDDPNPTKSDFYLSVQGQVDADYQTHSRIELDNFVLEDHPCTS